MSNINELQNAYNNSNGGYKEAIFTSYGANEEAKQYFASITGSDAVSKFISESQAEEMLLTNSFPIKECYLPLMAKVHDQYSIGLCYARVLVYLDNGNIMVSPTNYHMLNPKALSNSGINHRPFTQEASKIVAKNNKLNGVANKVRTMNSCIPAGLEYYPYNQDDETLNLSGTYQYRSTVAGKKGSNDETRINVRFEHDSLSEETVTKALNETFGHGCNGLFEVMIVGLITDSLAYKDKDKTPKLFFNMSSYSLYAREVRENSSNPQEVMESTPGAKYGKALGNHLQNLIEEAKTKKLQQQNVVEGIESKTGEDVAAKAAIGASIPSKSQPVVTPEPTQSVTAPEPTQPVVTPEPTQSVTAPEPTQPVVTPEPTQSVTAPEPASEGAVEETKLIKEILGHGNQKCNEFADFIKQHGLENSKKMQNSQLRNQAKALANNNISLEAAKKFVEERIIANTKQTQAKSSSSSSGNPLDGMVAEPDNGKKDHETTANPADEENKKEFDLGFVANPEDEVEIDNMDSVSMKKEEENK